MAAFAALAVALVALLGQLPAWEQRAQERRQATAVFTPVAVERLTNDNLVDAMVAVPLQQRLTRVGWDHAILSVDLTLRSPEAAPKDLWKDTAALLRFSFAQVTGVKQLLLRVFQSAGDGQRTLLGYADSRVADWSVPELAALKPPDGWPDAAWRSKLRLVLTPAGERWLRNVEK
jgi:hypothetical protein